MCHSPARLASGATSFVLAMDVSHLAVGQYALTLQVSMPLVEVFDSCEDCLTFELGSEHFAGVTNPFRQDWKVGSVLFPSTLERVE
jgi:hypothetical protein